MSPSGPPETVAMSSTCSEDFLADKGKALHKLEEIPMKQRYNDPDGRAGRIIRDSLPVVLIIVSDLLQNLNQANGATLVTLVSIAVQISAKLYSEVARPQHRSESIRRSASRPSATSPAGTEQKPTCCE